MNFQTEKSNLGLPKGKGVVGINWELGIKRHTLYIQNSRWEEKGTTGWDGWVASPTPWTWVWASPGSWWWTGRPGVLRSMGSQRVRHDWVPEKQLYKIDSKWGPTVYHTELYSASCNRLWWRRIWKRNIYLFLHFLTSLVEFILCNLGKVKGRPKLFCRPEAGDMGLCVCVNVTCVCLFLGSPCHLLLDLIIRASFRNLASDPWRPMCIWVSKSCPHGNKQLLLCCGLGFCPCSVSVPRPLPNQSASGIWQCVTITQSFCS